MYFIFKVIVQQSRTHPYLKPFLGSGGGGPLPVSVQNIVDCTGHIIGGHKEDAKFVVEGFFAPMDELDPEKKLVDLHMFDGDSVFRKAQKY